MKIPLLIHMKMPTIVAIFIFISRENFMSSCVEHEKSFITSGLVSIKLSVKYQDSIYLKKNKCIVILAVLILTIANSLLLNIDEHLKCWCINYVLTGHIY